MLKYIFIIFAMLSLGGCNVLNPSYNFLGNSDKDEKITVTKERKALLEKAQNYQVLIAIYKASLQKKEDPQERYGLANYYYLAGDYNSSMHYLKPLLETNAQSEAFLLQAKNLSALKRYNEALDYVNKAVGFNPRKAEGYNLKGIILSEVGQLTAAQTAFEQSRNLFMSDEIVNNNLAMISIFSEDYQNAVRYLLPLYQLGYKQPKVVHNLVFSLLKSGDYNYAKQVIMLENLSSEPDLLLSALATVKVQPYITPPIAN